MSYSLEQTVAPTIEPITTAEAKMHLRVDSSAEDTLIDALITTAREMAESHTGRQFITATYELKIDDFPDEGGDIYIPRTPLITLTSIEYVDTSGTTQTLSTTIYDVLSDDTQACVVLKPSKAWPITQSMKRHAVTVTFNAGYGAAASAVPKSAHSAMLLIIGNLFENREAVVTGTIATALPLGVRSLLDSFTARVPV